MVKYPIGQADFGEIRRAGCLYVDKTMYIHQLVSSGKFYFLSRPRRFGKSMLITTMEAYFNAERELFKGLAIDSLEPEEWTKYPVLHLDFTRSGYNKPEDLPIALNSFLDEWEKKFGEFNKEDSADLRFHKLIHHIYDRTGQPVVILIDEYDSPIVDVHDKPELEKLNRKILHDFYRVMKSNEKYLKFVFLTGVGKLGQINIFSGLNNIVDISLLPQYSAICGITTQELTDNFKEGIEDLGRDSGRTYDEALAKLKQQYDGYHFSKNMVDIYNPFSVVRALFARSISNYWFQSGTPTRLIQQFLSNDWDDTDLEGYVASRDMLESGDVLGDNLALTCYYTGYLTIKDYDEDYDEFTLGYPNAEVRKGFFNNLLKKVRHWNALGSDNFVRSLRRFIRQDDIEGFLREMKSFLAGIPYMSHTNKESQWQKDVLIISRLVGLQVNVEQRTSSGRMDMVLDGTKAIYIIEFKYGGTPEEALAQINEKDYALPYKNSLNPKPVVKVGVNISPQNRTIDGWVIENA